MANAWEKIGPARYVPIPGVEGLIANSPEMMAAMEEQARLGWKPARELARSEVYDSGKYHDSIKTGRGRYRGLAVGRLIASDFKSNWIEFGTVKWQAHAILRRACESAGLKFGAPGREA